MPAACSSGGSGSPAPARAALKPIRLQLQWFPQAQFAGYFAALDKGYYKEQGFDVTILPGAVEIVPATVVAGGQAEFGISWVPRMLAPRESGADGIVIGQIFQRSPTLQVSFKDKNITKPEDLKGKKVGSWGFGNEAELYAGLNKAGIDPANKSDVNIIAQQFDMVAFTAGEIDAAQAMIYNEYAQVLETKNPETGKLYTADDLNVISWEQYGTSMLQDAIFASDAWLKQAGNEDIAVKFLTASFKGWIFCRDNPAECVDIVLKHDAKLPEGPPDVAAQRGQRDHLARPERDRDHGQGGLRPDGRGRTRRQDPDQAGHRHAVAQRPCREGARRARERRHEGRVLAEGNGRPHRGRQVESIPSGSLESKGRTSDGRPAFS